MKDEGIPVYEQKNAIYGSRDFRFFIDDEKFQELQRFQVKTNDLIISCSGTVGKISIIEENDPKGIISQALLILRPDTKKIIHKFLYYFLSSKVGHQYLTQVSHGSVQVNIAKRADVEKIPIPLPSLPEQRAIAGVLSSLDDKIDLLHRQNETLEALAQTLFRQWFVEEAEDDWEEKELGEIIDTVSGFVHKREHLSDEGDYLLGMGSIIEAYGISREATKRASVKNLDTKYLCEVGDIVISTRDVTQDAKVLGFPGIIPSFYTDKKVIVGSNIYKIVIISSNTPGWFVYELLRSRRFRRYVINFASGTTVLMLRKSDFLNFKFNFPKEKFFKEHYLLFESIHGKLDLNYSSIIQLKNLRDTLLIKLMSGEVTIESLQGGGKE